MEDKLKLIQKTIRDLIKFSDKDEDLELDVAFLMANNEDDIIDEFRKMYYERKFSWVDEVDNKIADLLINIYGLYFDEQTDSETN
jgi:hypothetical protein